MHLPLMEIGVPCRHRLIILDREGVSQCHHSLKCEFGKSIDVMGGVDGVLILPLMKLVSSNRPRKSVDRTNLIPNYYCHLAMECCLQQPFVLLACLRSLCLIVRIEDEGLLT
jgi:hypothetical protein